MKYIFTIIFFCAFTFSNAQSINPSTDTVKWVYNKVKNIVNGESLTMSGSIISYGPNRFVWEQDGMSTKYEIESSPSNSTWSSAKTNGKLEVSSTCNGLNGTVKIQRTGNTITIELNFEQTGKLTPHLILTVKSYSKI